MPEEKLDQISNEALQLAKLYRYEEAKSMLDYFSNKFLESTKNGDAPYTMDQLRIVTVAHNEAVEAMVSMTMNHEKRLNKIMKFRLVVDAISSANQPLWTELEGPVMTAFQEVKEAADRGEREAFHERLNIFLSLYEVIYPSVKMNISANVVQQLDARVQFVDQYRPQVLSDPSSKQELSHIEADLHTVFEGAEEDEVDPSLWWVIISTGSIIIITLSYVGWRKYKGQKEKQRNYPPS